MASGRQWDLGQRKRGEVVRVTLRGNAANVLLLDSANLSNYKAGRRTRGKGGLVTRSPFDMIVPSSGHWYVVADMTGPARQYQRLGRDPPRSASAGAIRDRSLTADVDPASR